EGVVGREVQNETSPPKFSPSGSVRCRAPGHFAPGLGAGLSDTLYAKLNYNFIRDIAPVAAIIRQPLVMVVNPSVPARSVPEFIAYAKANPGKINMASPGIGSTPHLVGALFKAMANVDMVHVAYRGGAPALTDLMSGEVQVYFTSTVSSIEYIKTGRLRALAVTTAARSEVLPDLPTLGELPGMCGVRGFARRLWKVTCRRN